MRDLMSVHLPLRYDLSGRLPPMVDFTTGSIQSSPSPLPAPRDNSVRNKSLPALSGPSSNALNRYIIVNMQQPVAMMMMMLCMMPCVLSSDSNESSGRLCSGRSKDVLASYHIRGGPPLNQSISSNGLLSSGGWMASTLDEAEKAEEELKRELKKAKVMMLINVVESLKVWDIV